MLKYQLDSLEGLDESLRELYEEKDGKFVLKVDGAPASEDVSGLKAKVEELLNEKKAAARKAADAEEAARQAREEKARKEGDWENVAKGYEEKLSKLEADIRARDERAQRAEVDRTALELASKLAEGANVKILSRFIADRLRFEEGAVKVVDKDGKLTISTIDQLGEEFSSSAEFKSLLKPGSKARGGGASGADDNGGGAANKNPFARGEHFNLTEQARITRDNPQLAAQLKQAASR